MSNLFGGGGAEGGLLSNLFGGGGAEGSGAKGAGGEKPVRQTARPRPQPLDQPAGGMIATKPDGDRVPGAMATFLALVLAGLACLFLLVAPQVEVDDRDERVPQSSEPDGGFKGLYLEARGIEVTGEVGNPVETESKRLIEVEGPGMALVVVLPLFMVGFSYWSHRKTGLSRPLTIGMLALAVSVLFLGGAAQPYIPALIALAVGSFQARKAELPARVAERVTRDEDDDEDEVIDVDSVEEIDDEDDEDLDDDEDEIDDEDDEDLEDEDEDLDVEDEAVEDEDDEDEDDEAVDDDVKG